MKKMKIITELYILILGFALALILMVGFNRYVNSSVGASYENVISVYDVANNATSELCGKFAKLTLVVSDMFNGGKASEEEYQKAVDIAKTTEDEISVLMETLQETVTDPSLQDELAKFTEISNEELDLCSQVIAKVAEDDFNGALEMYTGELRPLDDENDVLAEQISEACEALSVSYAGEASRNRSVSGNILLAVAAVIIILALVMSAYVVRDIRVPLEETVEVVKSVSVGKVDVELKKHKDNEFGILADALRELIRRQGRVAEIADSLSKGDMTVEVHPSCAEDVLAHSLKNLVEQNNVILSNIRESSVQVGTGSRQVADASQSLAQGSTQQASALQQVTSSITDVTEKTKANAEDATRVNALILKTKDNAAQGNEEMTNMVQAMQDINESSENISKIIKTIDDIAFQTNILALNAAVEAARAGEHGKGFAVVAEEVRSLAAKSAEAASETEEMIEDSIQKVQNGSRLAETTAGMLGEIVTAVDNIVNLMSGITQASNDQAVALGQVDEAIMQVSQVVQTNSATSEECAAASDELSNQALTLQEQIGKFKLCDTAAVPAYSAEIGSSQSDSWAAPSAGYNNTSSASRSISGAGTYARDADMGRNEPVISLEDSSYSKY